MIRRKGNFIDSYIKILIGQHGLVNCKSEWMRNKSFKAFINICSCNIHVSSLKRNHDKWNFSFQLKHILEGTWIEENVELGSWSYVSLVDSSSHNDDFLQFGLKQWISEKEYANIGQTSSIGPNNLSFLFHNLLIGLMQTVFSDGFNRRLLKMNPSKAILAMHIFS